MRSWTVLLAIALAGLGGVAAADDASDIAGRVLEQVEVMPLGDGARVSVRFGCPLRYSSHFPATGATELRISLVPLPGCLPTDILDSALRAPTGNTAGLGDVRLEQAGTALVLTLAFSSPVDVAVRPTPDFMGLEIAVFNQATNIRPRLQTRTVAPPPPMTRVLPSAEVLEQQWAEAKAAFDAGDNPAAVRLLTRLVEYPEHPRRAEAQELLGLSRERNGQLAHAKAEYEEYLRSYPEGAAVGRVTQRLSALTTLSRPKVAAVAQREGGMDWTGFGGWAQEYRFDTTSLETADISTNFTSQSMVITDGDFSLRGRGERFDVQARVSAGYLYDLLPEAAGTQTRVSAAYAELNDRHFNLNARLGRQSKHSGGVLGSFDGLLLGWRALPSLRLNLMAGSPLETTTGSFTTDRQFVSLSANWSGWIDGLEISPFLIDQSFDGVADRRAVGSELRWFRPGRTVVGLFDYDIDYSALNMVLLLGNFELPRHWTITTTLDHRKSPFLTTRNAMAGQAVLSLGELVAQIGEPAVRALAEDRTADVDTVSIGVSRPMGTRYQWIADVGATRMSEMPASGGIEAIPATGTELSFGAQLIANSLLRSGDVSILGLRMSDGDLARTTSLSLSSRFPIRGRLRAGPRLRFDYREFSADGTTQWLASPAVRIDWHSERTTIEFEAGGEWMSRELPIDQEKSSRYWFSLGYRVGF
ncbi:MAG: tetratricopeptide repeat protein [Gammaproteobacteria bacterium]|nr:tetratricopeptide repeat protein [Gammaproteobacteria bacterium]